MSFFGNVIHYAESVICVSVPASVKLVPEDEREKQVALGDILALHCQAEGKPDPNVTWTRIVSKDRQIQIAHCKTQKFKKNIAFGKGVYKTICAISI